MNVAGRTVVVTGAAGGIGRALADRFSAASARVAALDMDAAAVAGVGDHAIACDVSDEQRLRAALADIEARLGPVEIFCANAGIAAGSDPLSTSHETWQRMWAVNVHAHVIAARALLPGWLERGEGYFVATASAAGLLTQIGSAPYAVTKHAAVAFAEWLSVTYGDRGVQVCCLCPMGVRTAMLEPGAPGALDELGAAVVKGAADVLEPEPVADLVLEAIVGGRFLVLPHPEVLTFSSARPATTTDGSPACADCKER